uniref:mRNA-capping enzyme n=1 Tax=Setaria digitata TaxID=48799 RepID=A0A915PZ12_9BILA
MASDEELNSTDSGEPNIDKARLGPPDRWLYCPPLGSVVAKHFLPFKTPLCKLYDDQIEKKWQFHPRDVFAHKFRGAESGSRIGLWIDLTKTNRYYSRKEVEKRSCIYKKIPLKGHGEAPSVSETEQFCRIVRSFLQAMAVHCTHGFNRTGFLIAAYLASAMDWAIDAAIYSFAQMRPNGIYKQLYLDELMQRYGDEDDRIEAPPRPAWENGPIDDGRIVQDDNGRGQAITSYDEHINEPKFMDGAVPSVKYVSDPIMRTILQNKIRDMCGYTRDGFPGSQPVSMERDNLHFLAGKKYMVSWKADGIRYMVLIDDEDSIYAFDRNNHIFKISCITFPHKKEFRHIQNTLVDCEMIIEKVKAESGEITVVPRLLIYDIIKFEGQNVGECNFTTRLSCIREDLIQPRRDALRSGRIKRENEPISIRNKEFWELEAVRKLFDEKFTRNVGHEIDGLIFQPVNEPYHCGRCDTLLKWKPPSHNSIDFQLRIRRISKPGELPEHVGFLFVQNQSEPMAKMKATKKLLPYDNKIIECTFKDGKWEFMRERTDKSLPNSSKTAKAVYNSIIHPIDKESLIAFVEKVCIQKMRKRPAPHQDNDIIQKIPRT